MPHLLEVSTCTLSATAASSPGSLKKVSRGEWCLRDPVDGTGPVEAVMTPLWIIFRFRKEGEVRIVNGLTLEVWAMDGREWAPRMSVGGGSCPRGSHQGPNLPTLVLEMIFRGNNNTIAP